ncbi:tripartite motif-containing protein 16-like protein isoform X1 [Neoarius graeffei]|uniref:tripartite motif-containing protein 16-like protein isoform X1 n=1 Tax=Neoarius graeffei TaxID=443677 RepID=UPI00298D1952|nr:tripartite motif-containing protein 16-like protein isoform X1 [Neoarius graeffei]
MATSSKPRNLHECGLCLMKSKDVVTIPCGHIYCRSCTDGLIGKYERTGSYNCPQCLQTFSTKPDQDGSVDKVVGKLKEINLPSETSADTSSSSLTRPDQDSLVDKLEKTALHTQSTTDTITRPEGVACDTCTDSRQKAVKSCLVCLASYCDTHLRLHNNVHARAAHTLVNATDQVRAMICSVHGKLLEIYCCKEKRRICCLCMLEDHKGHDMVAAGQAEKKELRKSKQMITEQEKQLKELHLAKNTLRDIAAATEEESERLFTELIHSITYSQAVMKVLIQSQEQAERERIKELMKQVEDDISELKKSDAEMEQLLSTQNDIQFLQSGQALSLTSANVLKMTINPQFSFGEVVKSISALKKQVEDVWEREMDQISAAVKKDKIVVPAEPKTRKDFLQYLVPLSLDPDTAHRSLSMCEEKQVTCSTKCEPCPDHPERFDWWAQVLCREPLNTCCYWEAEWTGLHGVDIAVSYRDISRKGDDDECSFGYNKQSWSLDCAILKYTFTHDNKETEISAPVSHRIGVYLDYKAGVLSFYSVSDCMTLLHRAETRFTQPLYAGFGLYQGSTVKICQPDVKQIDTQSVNSSTTVNEMSP